MVNSGIIITDVADHFGTFHMSSIKNKNKENSINKMRLFSENSINKFKASLDQTDFYHILEITCPNEAFNEFFQLNKTGFESIFPLREFRKKSYRY